MRRYLFSVIFLFAAASRIWGQADSTMVESVVLPSDSVVVSDEAEILSENSNDRQSFEADSVYYDTDDEEYVSLDDYAKAREAERAVIPDSVDNSFYWQKKFNPDPQKAVWFSAVLPGLGQIYNRQYWKLPIILGGAMGIAYAITWNNQMYIDYRKAYVDLIDDDPDTKGYEKLLPTGVTINDSNRSTYERTFENGQENYLRYRDLSIIAAGALYILVIIDAYVDAQLHDYDISPDLSLKVAPTVIPSLNKSDLDASVGVKCKLRF